MIFEACADPRITFAIAIADLWISVRIWQFLFCPQVVLNLGQHDFAGSTGVGAVRGQQLVFPLARAAFGVCRPVSGLGTRVADTGQCKDGAQTRHCPPPPCHHFHPGITLLWPCGICYSVICQQKDTQSCKKQNSIKALVSSYMCHRFWENLESGQHSPSSVETLPAKEAPMKLRCPGSFNCQQSLKEKTLMPS